MPEDSVPDPTDIATRRPKAPPLEKKGTGFQPMKLDEFDFEIHLPEECSPDDPITLFTQFYTPNIVDTIVLATNSYQRPLPDDEPKPHSRVAAWTPTNRKEIYFYLAFCIYMTVYPLNKISDYWSTKKLTPYHAITKVFSRNRFQELRRRFRVCPDDNRELFKRTEPLNTHIQDTNLKLWKPGRDLAVDEAVKRYTGRSKYVTTIPNKPTPTGIKIWVIAQRGFFLRWLFHVPGKNGGAFGVKKMKGLNNTQAVVPHLLKQLPKASYHVYLDNLFTSNKLLEYLRKQGWAATGTCRTTSGVLKDLIDLKKYQEKGPNAMPWGTVHAIPTETNMVNQTGFQDGAFALAMSTYWDGKKKVLRVRKRPKKTAGNAKVSRAPFGDETTRELWIPELYDAYNKSMGAVDIGDQLQGYNNGARRLRRGAIQGLHQYMLLVVLSNCYLICIHSGYKLESVNLRSQDDFRMQVIEALLAMGKDAPGPRKRRVSALFGDSQEVPVHRHEHVKMSTSSNCVSCKGGRFWDPLPRKRVALAEIAVNTSRSSKRTFTYWGCQQCQVHICKGNNCFQLYHSKS